MNMREQNLPSIPPHARTYATPLTASSPDHRGVGANAGLGWFAKDLSLDGWPSLLTFQFNMTGCETIVSIASQILCAWLNGRTCP